MSRLLFAAARGARIETKIHDGPWLQAYAASFPKRPLKNLVQRIHPEDAHLQHGPISTEFRTLAKNPPPSTSGGGPVVKEYINKYKFSDEVYMFMPDLDKSLFLLLISEVLADEGL
jgi:hypothetical protein